MRGGGTEPLPPLRLAVVAVRARVDQDVDAVVPDLERQRVGVGVGGDRQEAVRPAVAAAPDLRAVRRAGAQEDHAGVGELPGRPIRPIQSRRGRPSEPSAAACTLPAIGGHQAGAPRTARPPPSGSRPGIAVGVVEDQAPPLVAVALAGRPARRRRASRRRRRASGSTAPRRRSTTGGPARRPRPRRPGRARARSGGSRWPARGSPRSGKVLAASSRSSRAAASSATAALRRYHGKAQAAASRPAASAMTWLFAEEPRLGNAARYSWCHRDLGDGVVVVLEEVADLRPVVRAAGGSRPRRSAGRRARSRWSSARRTGTGWRPTRTAAGPRPPRRSARRPVSHYAAASTVSGGGGTSPRPA